MLNHSASPDPTRPRSNVRFFWTRLPMLLFAWTAYVLFARSTLYLIGFVGNIVVPRTIDDPSGWPPISMAGALTINTALVLIFCSHHSLFARRLFKEWVRRFVPLIERSIYVLISSLLLIFLMWQWRSLPQPIWSVESRSLVIGIWILFAAGWLLALASSFRLGHSETFGVRAVLRHFQQRVFEPRGVEQRWMYAWVRHPMYAGFLIGIWATPTMSLGHLQLASLLTLYILLGRRWEERDLVARFGRTYQRYVSRVPAFLPRIRPSSNASTPPRDTGN